MIAKNIAPGLSRSFASEDWDAIPRELWKQERANAFKEIRNDVSLKIYGSDIDPAAIKIARENAEEAGVGDLIKFSTAASIISTIATASKSFLEALELLRSSLWVSVVI